MSLAAESPTEKGRLTTEASSEAAVSSTARCHSLMGRQETPIQCTAARCHFIQHLVLIPGAAILQGFGYWQLG